MKKLIITLMLIVLLSGCYRPEKVRHIFHKPLPFPYDTFKDTP